ncbi:unnamed protein product [Prorocentrum cordatum]|uniref:Uncharacterized protein n=1 Tax=Prorocentrum cordatum TaxID=2364126 RepID=A0ABN9QNJ2_9DINO|nr:unnamed protein product [Polarella glacialis]
MKAAALCLAALAHGALGAQLLRGQAGHGASAGAAGAGAGGRSGRHSLEDEKPLTQVVRLLEEMLKKSQAEQDKDREAYAKFKCYCDTQTEEKEKIIEEATKAIELLSAAISELQGANGELSIEAARLKKEMEANEQTREVATELRGKEEAAYLKLKDDLTANIPLLAQAIQVLGEIGADQTLETSAAHEQFMGGFNESEALVSLESKVRTALLAAKALLKPGDQKQQRRLSALLQAPLGTTYETQSGEIVGILREMKETFEENLAEATAAEQAAVKAHLAFIQTKEEEYAKLEIADDDVQDTMGTNDGSLAAKKTQLEVEVQSKADAEDFLSKLGPMCSDKATDYEARKLFRANEQAAISEAIALLNSDAAYKIASATASLGGGAPPSKGAPPRLLQLGRSSTSAVRQRVEGLLAQAAARARSARLRRVVASLSAGNPFDTVLAEIEKIQALIQEEGRVDAEQKAWCEGERETNERNLDLKKKDIETLNGDISELVERIENPETGLKASIAIKEEELVENTEAMKEATDQRRTENLDYQGLVANTSEARALLAKAIAMIESYYAAAYKEATAALQEDPAPPETWEDGKIGTQEKGTEVVTMLKFLLGEVEKEESSAHQTEQKAQSDYEGDMTQLKQTEADLQDALAGLQEELAEAEKTLVNKRSELAQTIKDKDAIIAYLEQIKPGCDFIITNFDTREQYRATEASALERAVELLQASPAYVAAKEAEKQESWGDCKEVCLESGETHAKCLACNAKVSVPGYCAGHAGVAGCEVGGRL